MLTLQPLLWLCLAAYCIHVLEEFFFDWRNWAREVLRLPVDWDSFYLTNALVIVLGIAAAQIAPVLPSVALSFPALMLINAICFHIAPFIWTRGRFSPGLITAVLLFCPLGYQTISSGNPTERHLIQAFLIGASLMATPIVFLRLKHLPYFNQQH